MSNRRMRMRPGRRTLLNWYVMLIVASLGASLWVAYRKWNTGSGFYEFMIWNLFLAWIPFWSATAIHILRNRPDAGSRRLWTAVLGVIWLLFLPNAPYMATDLIHVVSLHNVRGSLYSDMFMILAFIWIGMLLGFLSLYLLHQAVENRYGKRIGWGFVAIVLPSTAAGVYVGRVLRWNSWDLLTRPFERAVELDVFFSRAPYSFIAGVTALCAIGYITLYALLSQTGLWRSLGQGADTGVGGRDHH